MRAEGRGTEALAGAAEPPPIDKTGPFCCSYDAGEGGVSRVFSERGLPQSDALGALFTLPLRLSGARARG